MKITEVKVDLYNYPAQTPFKWRFGLPGSDPGGIGARLQIITDDGLEGWAFCNRGRIFEDLVNRRNSPGITRPGSFATRMVMAPDVGT